MRTLALISFALLAANSAGAQQSPARPAPAPATAAAPVLAPALAPAAAYSVTTLSGQFASRPLTLEPADSLYRMAQAALTAGDFLKAAELFRIVAERYPDSDYAPNALYYRAYALFRGAAGSRDLDLAAQALDRQAQRYPKAATISDAKQLRQSIRAEQARRGNGDAFNRMQEDANRLKQEKGCPTDDDEARIIALQGIAQNDPDQVLPVLQKLLSRTDECSIKLRRRALYMVAQTREEERSDILLKAASSDPSVDVRREAVQWLSEVNTERAAKALDSILFSAGDAEMRDRALAALARHRSVSARASVRRFAEQSNVPIELRMRAVSYIANGPRKTGGESGDESEYLHGLFNKTASPELREAIIDGVSQLKAPDRTPWLLDIARDKGQETEVRKKALYAAGQSGVELKELLGLYDEMSGQPEMQAQMLYVYRQRKEPEATDKLMQIAKTEKNPELRRKAIAYLGDRKDPRVRQFLLDIVNP